MVGPKPETVSFIDIQSGDALNRQPLSSLNVTPLPLFVPNTQPQRRPHPQ